MSSAQAMTTDGMAPGGDARLARAMDEALQLLDQAWSQAQRVEDVARLGKAFSCLGEASTTWAETKIR
jgi:glycine/serine hydroxymethyltransferase